MSNMSLEDEIESGPDVGSGPSGSKYIGVPEGYLAAEERPDVRLEGRGWWTPPPTVREPRYKQGDEYKPAGLGASRIARLQLDLANSGLMGKKPSFRMGVWDEPSRLAYKKLLAFSNQYGVDYENALDRLTAAPLVDEDERQEGDDDLPAVRLTNPDDLRAVIQLGARQHIGRRLDDSEVERIVASYQASEAATQRAAHEASETGGTYTDMADPSTFAEQQIRATHAVEAGGHDVANVFSNFLKIIEGAGLR